MTNAECANHLAIIFALDATPYGGTSGITTDTLVGLALRLGYKFSKMHSESDPFYGGAAAEAAAICFNAMVTDPSAPLAALEEEIPDSIFYTLVAAGAAGSEAITNPKRIANEEQD